jgi:protein-disulfide isomerase
MSNLKPPVGDNDHQQGNPDAVIELVEYGDYECPHCGRAYPILKAIQEKMGDRLRFVFRNFPLSESHPHARNAAIAAEAAAAQGRFWEMHDLLFENQFNLRDSDILKYAVKAGLSPDRFKKDILSESIAARVDDDFESGVRSGVNGTPSFFINGRKFGGDWSEEPFLEQLESVYAKKQHG